MTYFSISTLINALSCGLVGLLVFSSNKRSPVNRAFFFLSLTITWWSLAYFMGQISDTEQSALLWSKILTIGAVLTPVAHLGFTARLTKQRIPKQILQPVYIVTALLLLGNIGNYLVAGVRPVLSFAFWPSAGLAYTVFIIFWICVALYSMSLLLRCYKKSHGQLRAQLGLIMLGNVIGYLGAASNYPLWYDIRILPWGNLLVSVYALIITYTIVTHHLFDIRLIIKRTFVYSLLMGFVFTIYAGIVLLLTQTGGQRGLPSTQETLLNLASIAVIGFTVEPLRRVLSRFTEAHLFPKRYNLTVIQKRLAEKLNNVVTLDEALEILLSVTTETISVKQAVMYVFQGSREADATLEVKRIRQFGYPSATQILPDESSLGLQYCAAHNGIVIKEQIERELNREKRILKGGTGLSKDTEYISAHAGKYTALKLFNRLNSQFAFPLLLNKQPLGLILLGANTSNRPYDEEDFELLEAIGAQAIISIEKANLYENDQMKTEFVSIASHELLTPISAMQGYLSMILDENIGEVDSQARGYLDKVYPAVKRLSALVKDILSVSRIESGKIKVDLRELKPESLIQEALEQVKVKAEEKQLALNFAKPSTILPSVYADHDKIIEILINLIGNGIKYTPSGNITVYAGVSADNKDMVQIDITDTGLGMTKQEQAHLFEKFYRVSNTDTAGISGTGLGLYITKLMVEKMGGQIFVKSARGKGSTFSFTLPVFKS